MDTKTLLQKLVQSDSTCSQGELESARILKDFFQQHHIETQVDAWDGNRANCIAQIRGGGKKKSLLFLCHIDVVPPGDVAWKHPPFSGIEVDGHIYGRGSTDMKGGTAAAAIAMRDILAEGIPLQGDLIFAATAGEETDSCGVDRFVENTKDLPDLAGILIPEPTDFSVIHAHRGLLWLQITTQGKTAHGSTPHLGINAIQSMAQVMDLLVDYPLPQGKHTSLGTCSMSINTITGGNALNVVPDQCTLGVDIRTLPGQTHSDLISDLQERFAKLNEEDPNFQAEVSIVRSVGALETDPQDSFVQTCCQKAWDTVPQAVGFTTDAPSVVSLGAPIVVMGPGKGEKCHQPDESIALADVDKAVELYKTIIKTYLT